MKYIRMMANLTLSALILSSLFLLSPAAADIDSGGPPRVDCNGETRTGSAEFYGRIEYATTYNRSANRLCTVAKNTGERNQSFSYVVLVDDRRLLERHGIELAPGDEFRDNRDITGGIDVTRDSHTVTVATSNNNIKFNFTQNFDFLNETEAPAPFIRNIIVERNSTNSGQPNLIIGFENNGSRNYSPTAVVKTFESDLRWMSGGGSQGGRFATRLSERADQVIVGTVKLYGDTYYNGTKFDRVSFVSYPNGTLETWGPEFGHIPSHREIEEREVYYENESAREKYTGPDVDPISERASKLGAILVVAVLIAGVWYRRRNRR